MDSMRRPGRTLKEFLEKMFVDEVMIWRCLSSTLFLEVRGKPMKSHPAPLSHLGRHPSKSGSVLMMERGSLAWQIQMSSRAICYLDIARVHVNTHSVGQVNVN